jgi:dethiobiotin synthetase
MNRTFVTATGTDVGKTVVTCALTHQLVQQGRHVRTIKPIISGYTAHTMDSIDTAEIIRALGQHMSPETIAQVSPWRFTHALAPDMAALREGREIDYDDLLDFCHATDHGENHFDDLLIEGVGGAFVPLDHEHLVVDWINDLDIGVIVVAGSYLGTLSHTVATVEALRGRGVTLKGIIISESETSPVPMDELTATMRRLIPETRISVVPRVPHWSGAPDLTALLS